MHWLKIFNTRGFWIGFTLGLSYFFYTFFWLWNLYPLESFGISNSFVSFSLILILFLIGSAGMAFWWGMAGLFSIKFLRIEGHNWFIPLAWASTFVLAEYLRTFFFGIIFIGNGSIIGPHWTIGSPAYLLQDLDYILKTSSIWGIYGIDFVLAYLIGGILLFTRRKDFKNLLVLAWVPAILLCLNTFLPDNRDKNFEEKKLPIALIQTKIPSKLSYTSEEGLDNFKKKLELLEGASEFLNSHESSEKGIAILPEGSHLLNSLSVFLNENSLKNYFDNLSEKEILVIDQVKSPADGNLKSKVVLINSKDGLIGTYDKKLLTPGGEFTPYIIKIPLTLFWPKAKESLLPDTYPGSGSNLIEFNGQKIKIVVCSELLSPSIVGDDNGDLIVALHNFGLFNGGRLLESQILAMSRFRAVENKKYSITSSNYGQSYIINPDGVVEKKASGIGYELLTGEIAPNKDQTWYNYVGDWPILLLSSVFFGFAIRKIPDDSKS